MSKNGVTSILKNLIKTCRAGQNAFRSAAENIQNSEFRRLFNIFSQQRAQFMTELQTEVHRLEGSGQAEEYAKEQDNTLPFRSSKTSQTTGFRDEASVIAECQREEEAAVIEYQKALEADLPLDVQYVVKRQYMDIKDAYDRIRILQRAA